MRVISRRALREFSLLHPDAAAPLNRWAATVEASTWNHPADVRHVFRSVDFVGDLTVFDIGGNKYRLIAFVHYRKQTLFIKHVLTHQEYDKGAWKP